jgi:hypothetical protein
MLIAAGYQTPSTQNSTLNPSTFRIGSLLGISLITFLSG